MWTQARLAVEAGVSPTTVSGIESDVTRLISEMEASIKEADEFIKQMK